ncbi:putative uncharacterized protein [Aliivibrio wodanis]|uniref:Uncharacterized protein n=1 Tax=Aliivibrio wodanis TaxID=80852 RepID=A0A090KH72_9GAMM|nr:putative uncharacterized protein [Aliivibrio wodanis]
MSSYVLCIFEGKRAEPNITNNLCVNLLQDEDKVILRASYGCNIYKLYAEIEKDPYLDTYELLVEELIKRQKEEQRLGRDLREEELAVLNIDDSSLISDIYLIFDYDAHCSNANDKKLVEMLDKFNNPQEEGLLIVSYPMVEAIRHQRSVEYREELYALSEFGKYKNWTNKDADLDKKYHNWGAYDFDTWREIVAQHLARANHLVTNELSLPKSQIEQQEIFIQQLDKHVPNGNIAVISSFPLMLFDYYGQALMSKLRFV